MNSTNRMPLPVKAMMISRMICVSMVLGLLAIVRAAEKVEPARYEPTTESLRTAAIPEWFIDGKLGIFMHWGPESLAGYKSCWYARQIYEEGSDAYKYHCATYGHPSKFGYKDLVKLFKAPKFDQAQADKYVKLYKQAGARYVVPVASLHDNFDMWDSKFQPRWNSVTIAGKDVVGMWQKATVANGLHFGVASHVARTYRWLQTSHGADKTGPLAGVPYDGQDPAYQDLYGVPWNDTGYGYEGPGDVGPPAFEKNFEDRMKDLIDKYHPELYYTDGGPAFKTAGFNVVAHLYNENQKLNGGKLQAVANFKGRHHIGAENYEFEYPAEAQPFSWQTDKTINGDWYWWRNDAKNYRKGLDIVHTLIDVVSKNGNLLLNVPLTPDGELEDEVITMLKVMGHDFNLIGEAIFATRPWESFGEGQKNFNSIDRGSAADIRFTRNKANTILYATTLGWPGDGAVLKIKTLNQYRINLKSLTGVSLVGSADPLIYSQDGEFLKITMPAKAPYECNAYPLKLTFSGQLPKLKPAAKLLWQAKARDVSDAEDRAALGLPGEAGVLILNVPAGSDAAGAGLKKDDVIIACNGTEVKTVVDLWVLADNADGRKLTLTVSRGKKQIQLQLTDYNYIAAEYQATPGFNKVAVAPVATVLPAKASAGGSPTLNDPIDVLTDGKVVMGFGPIFPNGVNVGMYKLDLANVQPVAQVNTFTAGGGRARQNFLLYGSTAATDPGWNVTDPTVFTPVNGVDTRLVKPTAFEATSIRRSNGKPLGNYRWLVWALSPLEDGIGGGNSSFQELQVIPVTKR